MSILALDTSNYTTSVASLPQSPHEIQVPHNALSLGKLLEVPEGALGLRQQEALFQHIKALPALLEQLPLGELNAVGVSTRPRAVEGSYMPCFLAGENFGRAIASSHKVPCLSFSHQQGHLAAALWALGREDMMHAPFLAWHLSGGTTELLLVTPCSPQEGLLHGEKIGGTTDISAGQLIDRSALRLGASFPGGKQLDTWALEGCQQSPPPAFPIKTQDLYFSLSGMENKVEALEKQSASPQEISAFVLSSLSKVLKKVGDLAQKQHQITAPIVFSGGVASSAYLKSHLPQWLFPPAQYATDNAMGIAVLTRQVLEKESHL